MRHKLDTNGGARAVTAQMCAKAHKLVMESLAIPPSYWIKAAIREAYKHRGGLPDWSGQRKYLSLHTTADDREAIQEAASACGLPATVWIKLMATAHLTPLIEQLKAARKVLEGNNG